MKKKQIQIDYDAAQIRAKNLEIPPYTLIKRELNFRATQNCDNCWICEYRYSAVINNQTKQSCIMIGVSPDYKGIDQNHVCDNFSLSCERRDKK